jgi:hypothetical protein
VKGTFYYPRFGMDKCKYCSAVCEIQTRLDERGYVSGRSTSPEPEATIPSKEEYDLTNI